MAAAAKPHWRTAAASGRSSRGPCRHPRRSSLRPPMGSSSSPTAVSPTWRVRPSTSLPCQCLQAKGKHCHAGGRAGAAAAGVHREAGNRRCRCGGRGCPVVRAGAVAAALGGRLLPPALLRGIRAGARRGSLCGGCGGGAAGVGLPPRSPCQFSPPYGGAAMPLQSSFKSMSIGFVYIRDPMGTVI